MGGGAQDKLLDLYYDSKAHKYDILLIQETKTKLNEIAETLAGIAHMVFEAHNPDNHIKGGVAIIIINPDINPELVNTDKNFNWYYKVPVTQRASIQADAALGRWIHIKFQHNNKLIHLINMYAPSHNAKSRKFFYKAMRYRWARLHNILLIGDFNNVEDETRDRLRPKPPQHIEDVTTFLDMRTSHRLLDAYIEQYELDDDEPVMMTNTTNTTNGITNSRIDRAYYSRSLHGIIRFDEPDTIPTCAVNTQGHSPIAITILDPKVSRVHQYKKNMEDGYSLHQ